MADRLLETPVSVAASPRHGDRPADAAGDTSAALAGSIPEPDLVEGDLLLVGVAWYRVGPDLALEGPINRRPVGGLW